MKIGVLALQGAFREHVQMLRGMDIVVHLDLSTIYRALWLARR